MKSLPTEVGVGSGSAAASGSGGFRHRREGQVADRCSIYHTAALARPGHPVPRLPAGLPGRLLSPLPARALPLNSSRCWRTGTFSFSETRCFSVDTSSSSDTWPGRGWEQGLSPRARPRAPLPASPAWLARPLRPSPRPGPAPGGGRGRERYPAGRRGRRHATCRLHSRPWSAFTVSCMTAAAASTPAGAHPDCPPPCAAAPGARRNRPPPPEAARGARPAPRPRLRPAPTLSFPEEESSRCPARADGSPMVTAPRGREDGEEDRARPGGLRRGAGAWEEGGPGAREPRLRPGPPCIPSPRVEQV